MSEHKLYEIASSCSSFGLARLASGYLATPYTIEVRIVDIEKLSCCYGTSLFKFGCLEPVIKQLIEGQISNTCNHTWDNRQLKNSLIDRFSALRGPCICVRTRVLGIFWLVSSDKLSFRTNQICETRVIC